MLWLPPCFQRTKEFSSYFSSNGAACVGIGVGVAVQVWCKGDVGGQAPSSLTLTLGWGWVGREPWVGCATPRLGIPVVYIEFKLSPMYHLEEGIKEESRNRYFCMM